MDPVKLSDEQAKVFNHLRDNNIVEIVLDVDGTRYVLDLQQDPIAVRPVETFEQAWAHMKAKGYDYGEDALEQVKLGFALARGEGAGDG